MDKATLDNRLKGYRLAAGLTQQALAAAAGINIRQLQKYESGEYDTANMTLKTAIALAEALGVDAKELVSRD